MKFKNTKLITLLAFALLSLPLLAFGQTGGTIRGTVTSEANNEPLSNVTVRIVQLRRVMATNDIGTYEFTSVPSGNYTVLTHIEGFADKALTVTVGANTAAVDFRLNLNALREEVTVTATGQEQSTFDAFQTVNSVSKNRIVEQINTSLGEVLEREPGVSKRAFGPGPSRPVIRGFDGDRVLVLDNGIRVGSVGSTSGDHGEPIDPLAQERIEVLKGPATLLYGSNATGGVVNTIGNEDNERHTGFRGGVTVLGGTNNNQFGLNGNAKYGYRNWLFFGNLGGQRTSSYQTPLGEVPNSGANNKSGSGGFGYFADKGFFRARYSEARYLYGVPFTAFFESGGESNEEEVDLRLRRRNFRVTGGFRGVDSFINAGNFTVDFTDYKHNELADGVSGTQFDNDTLSYRGVLDQRGVGRLTGRFGFEGFKRDFLNTGEELLIDGKIRHNMNSGFVLEELNFERFKLQFGGRVENNRYNSENPTTLDRTFTGFSGAVGARFGLWEGGAVVANYTHSYRAPALEELYNFGPHIGTVSFEIGNELLRPERSNGIEFSFRQLSNRVRAEVSFFHYRIGDFVYLAPQDEDGDGEIDIEDGLRVAAYEQNDSRFTGGEVSISGDVNQYFGLFFDADVVKATLTGSNIRLPRIPPARARFGVDFRYKGLSVRPEAIFAGDKRKIFTTETPTAGYGLFNVSGSYTISRQRYAHIFSVSGFNLGDRLYRNHLSFIKDLAPEIGRGIRAAYTVRFF